MYSSIFMGTVYYTAFATMPLALPRKMPGVECLAKLGK
jgi:hypothetical protein